MDIFLIVLAVIVLLVGILLVSNVGLKIYLSRDGFVVVKYLFLRFKFDVYGENKLKHIKKSKPKKAKKKSKKGKEEKKEGYFKKTIEEKGLVEGTVQFLSIIKLIISKIADVASKCKISNLILSIKTAADEPSETAIYYGAVSAVVYPALGVLNGIFPIKKQNVSITADYNAQNPEIEFMVTLKIRVYSLIRVLFSFIKDYIQGGY